MSTARLCKLQAKGTMFVMQCSVCNTPILHYVNTHSWIRYECNSSYLWKLYSYFSAYSQLYSRVELLNF